MPAQIFDSESEWVHSTIDETCIIEYGTRVTRKRDAGTIYPVYGGGGATFQMDSYNREDRMVVSRFAMSETCTRFVESKFFLNDSGLTLRPKNENALLPIFLDWLIHSLNDEIYSLGRGTAQKNLNMEEFRKLPIRYPKDISEQHRIVGILDEAFENMSNSSKRVEQKLIDAKELFSSLVEEKYTDKEGQWNQKTISELCKIGDGNHSSKYPKKSEMVETGIPFIRGTNLVNGRISDDDIRYITKEKHSTLKKGHLLTGDVLFTNRGEIGKVAIVDERFDNANLNSQLAWFRCGEEITPEFLFYFLQKGEMKRHFSQSKTGTALQQFTIKMIKSVSISYPSIEEQKEIVESCQLMEKKVEEITHIYLKESDSIVELKQSILQEAFNGTL